MILEAVLLNIKTGLANDFESSFNKASRIISSVNGYLSHEIHKCLEAESRGIKGVRVSLALPELFKRVEGKYLLLIKWETLADHTVGFRSSLEYQEWRKLLHHFYEPFPTVEHFKKVELEY